jgi:hypothetical protein
VEVAVAEVDIEEAAVTAEEAGRGGKRWRRALEVPPAPAL